MPITTEVQRIDAEKRRDALIGLGQKVTPSGMEKINQLSRELADYHNIQNTKNPKR